MEFINTTPFTKKTALVPSKAQCSAVLVGSLVEVQQTNVLKIMVVDSPYVSIQKTPECDHLFG